MNNSLFRMRILLLLSIVGGALTSFYLFSVNGINRYEIMIAIAQITITIILGIVTYFQADTQNKLDMLDKIPYLKLSQSTPIVDEDGEKKTRLHFETDNSIGIVNAKAYKVDISKRCVRLIEEKHLSKCEKALKRFFIQCKNFEYTKPGDEITILDAFYKLKNKYSDNKDFWDRAERCLLNQVYWALFYELKIEHPFYSSKQDVYKVIDADIRRVEELMQTDKEKADEEIRKRKERYEYLIHWYPDRTKVIYNQVLIKNMKNKSSTDSSFDIDIPSNNDREIIFAIKYYSVFLYPYTQIVKFKTTEEYKTAVFIGFRKKISRKEFDKYFE